MGRRKSQRIRKFDTKVGARQKLKDLLDFADDQDRERTTVDYSKANDDDTPYRDEIAAAADKEKADLEARLEREDAERISRAGLCLDPDTLELKPRNELSPEVQRALELKYLGEPHPPGECCPMTQEDGVASFVGLVRNDAGHLVPMNQNNCGFHAPEPPKPPKYNPDGTSPIIMSYLLKQGITQAQIDERFQGKKFNLIDARKLIKETQEAIQNGGVPMALRSREKIVVDLGNGLPKHRLQLMRDHKEEYPDLFLQVHIVGPSWEERPFMEMLTRARCTRAKSITESDLVIFTGGIDVDPALYGEAAHRSTGTPSSGRDNADIEAFVTCVENGIPMLGICRGAQLGHVGHGGVLFQDVDNHNRAHSIWDVNRKITIDKVSSVHHQMCKAVDNGMELIAVASESRKRWLNPNDSETGKNPDIEAFFYKDTCFIGIQGHPEYSNYPQFTKWSLQLVNELVCCNPDVEWNNAFRRIKPDIIAGRDYEIPQTFLDRVRPPAPAKPKRTRTPKKETNK